jgi:hypothetical protein
VLICKKLIILSIFSGLFQIEIKNCLTPLTHSHALVFLECVFVFFHRFTENDDYRWFYKTIERVAEEELGAKYQPMVKKEEYFVDFLRYHHLHIHI